MRAIATAVILAGLTACAHAEQEDQALAAEVAAQASSVPTWANSKFGPKDRLGALNHLSPEKTAAAARLISAGKTYSLGMVTGPNTAAYGPRSFEVTVLQLDDGTGAPQGANRAVSNDDKISGSVGVGSQIDGLGHFGIGHRYYNGVPAADVVRPDGLIQFGTHTLPPIATRGILLDMTAQFGTPVPDGTPFNVAEIEAALAAADLSLEAGDVVIFHTGKMAASDPSELYQTYPGLGVAGAEYLAEKGVVAVGSDTWGLEVIPFEDPTKIFDVHATLLVKNGVYILENMVTEELAADGVTEFFFSLGVPRLEGTVQAIINPVAIR
ncbi:MAG: cyclase family protein [Pseudomonadota bacterium]